MLPNWWIRFLFIIRTEPAVRLKIVFTISRSLLIFIVARISGGIVCVTCIRVAHALTSDYTCDRDGGSE